MSAEERTAAYQNGIGVMPAKARMAASEKGYENGIRVMQAGDRTAASEKGYVMGSEGCVKRIGGQKFRKR